MPTTAELRSLSCTSDPADTTLTKPTITTITKPTITTSDEARPTPPSTPPTKRSSSVIGHVATTSVLSPTRWRHDPYGWDHTASPTTPTSLLRPSPPTTPLNGQQTIPAEPSTVGRPVTEAQSFSHEEGVDAANATAAALYVCLVVTKCRRFSCHSWVPWGTGDVVLIDGFEGGVDAARVIRCDVIGAPHRDEPMCEIPPLRLSKKESCVAPSKSFYVPRPRSATKVAPAATTSGRALPEDAPTEHRRQDGVGKQSFIPNVLRVADDDDLRWFLLALPSAEAAVLHTLQEVSNTYATTVLPQAERGDATRHPPDECESSIQDSRRRGDGDAPPLWPRHVAIIDVEVQYDGTLVYLYYVLRRPHMGQRLCTRRDLDDGDVEDAGGAAHECEILSDAVHAQFGCQVRWIAVDGARGDRRRRGTHH